jgi:MFS family permease
MAGEGGLSTWGLRRHVLPTVLSCSYILAFSAFLAFLPPHLRNEGVGAGVSGLLIGIFRIAPLLVALPFGLLADRLEPKQLVTVGLAVFASALAVAAAVRNLFLIFLLFLLAGFAGSLFQVNNQAGYYKVLGERSRAAKLGWYQGVTALGFGLGPLFAGLILRGGWLRSPMLIGSLLILPFVFLSLSGERVPGTRVSLPEYRRDLALPGVWLLATIVLLFSFHFGVEASCFTLFLQDVLRQNDTQVGTTYLYISTALAVVMVGTGLVSQRVHQPRLTGFLALICSGVGNLVMPWVRSLGWLLAARFLHVLGDGAFVVFQSIIIANFFHRQRLGGNLGVFVTMGNIGYFVGAAVSGYVPGNVYPFFLAGLLAFLATFLFAVWGRPLWTAPPDVASAPDPGSGGAGDGRHRLQFVPIGAEGG